MKKSIPLGLVLLFALFIVNIAFRAAPEQTKQETIAKIIQNNYPEANLSSKDISLERIASHHLANMFERTQFHDAKVYLSLPPRRVIFAEHDTRIYELPHEFNFLLEATDAPRKWSKLDIAFNFVLLTDPEAMQTIELQRETIDSIIVNPVNTIITFATYSKLGGIEKDWKFTFRKDKVIKVSEIIMKKNYRDYVEPPDDYASYGRTIGLAKFYYPATYTTPVQSELSDPVIEVNKYYVTIRENNSPTDVSERTVEFTLNNFDPLVTVELKVSSFDGTDLSNPKGDFLDIEIETDESGDASYKWIVSGESEQSSDIAEVIAIGSVDGEVQTIYLPRSETFALQDKWFEVNAFDVSPSFDLEILYCTGYESYIGATAEEFLKIGIFEDLSTGIKNIWST